MTKLADLSAFLSGAIRDLDFAAHRGLMTQARDLVDALEASNPGATVADVVAFLGPNAAAPETAAPETAGPETAAAVS